VSAEENVRLEIERRRLVAIVRGESADSAVNNVRVLAAAGVAVLEISLGTPGALEAISAVSRELPAGHLLGAGTVRSAVDAEAAIAAGASFLVSPHLASEVGEAAHQHEILHLRGVFTPTELAAALDAGAQLIKLFPAGWLGPGYVRDLLAPFPSALTDHDLTKIRAWQEAGLNVLAGDDPIAFRYLAAGVDGAIGPPMRSFGDARKQPWLAGSASAALHGKHRPRLLSSSPTEVCPLRPLTSSAPEE
jgi:Entner-Doudoroff aldolase